MTLHIWAAMMSTSMSEVVCRYKLYHHISSIRNCVEQWEDECESVLFVFSFPPNDAPGDKNFEVFFDLKWFRSF